MNASLTTQIIRYWKQWIRYGKNPRITKKWDRSQKSRHVANKYSNTERQWDLAVYGGIINRVSD